MLPQANVYKAHRNLEKENKKLRAEFMRVIKQRDDLLAALKRIEWISIEDRLPKKCGVYFIWWQAIVDNVHTTPTIVKAWWTGVNWDIVDYVLAEEFIVTHWMPLPEPPEQAIASVEKEVSDG